MISDDLYDFQRVAVDFAHSRRDGALFLEQGTGKTYITSALVERLLAPCATFLVVVPLANIETTWERTLAKVDVVVCRSLDQFLAADDQASRLLLLHYEAVRGRLAKRLARRRWTLVTYDESQRLKARGSQASRAAAKFHDVERRVILSGTPIEQAPQDLWAQFRFALPDVFGKRWRDFKETWLQETGYMGYKLEFRAALMPRFLELVGPHIHRVRKQEVLDLPPLRYIRCPVELIGDQRRIYREVTKDMVATVGEDTVTCDLAITQLVRQQQITGGFVHLDSGAVVSVGTAKIRRLKRILRDVSSPIVVFCKYAWEVDAISRACASLRVGQVTGRTRRTRVETIDAFQRGEIDVLVCQIRAGGVGIDLFRASEIVFYSCTFSSVDFEQAVCRVHRNGQTRPVNVRLLQAAETIDKTIWSALIAKKAVVQAVLGRLPKRKRHHGRHQGEDEE